MKILTTVEKKKVIAHARFDWMWDSHTQEGCVVFANRDVAYMFLAFYLCLPEEEAAEIAENLISYNNKVAFKETTDKMRDEMIELLG